MASDNAPGQIAGYLHAEVVEADIVVVGELGTITLEASEIRAKKTLRVKYYPTVKDPGFFRLEGDVVEAKVLDAHHVRARLVIADKITAHSIRKSKTGIIWSSDGGTQKIVNRCVSLNALGPELTPDCGE